MEEKNMKSRFSKQFLSIVLVGGCILSLCGCQVNSTSQQKEEEIEKVEYQLPDIKWTDISGKELGYDKTQGIFYYLYWKGPNGMETYYCQSVDSVVNQIRKKNGFSEEDYPYWIDDAGFKRLGDYIICAANIEKHPKGTLVEGKFGTYIVCDTGTTFEKYPDQIQIATDWERYSRWLTYSKNNN